MKRLGKILMGLSLTVFTMVYVSHDHTLCEGFLPENSARVPVNKNKSLKNEGGLSKEVTDKVIQIVEDIYKPIVKKRYEGNLKIVNNWKDDRVNAFAKRPFFTRTYHVEVWGGLARHKETTVDGLITVLCHELGHHIGGSPKNTFFLNRWASVEGQSDYWANAKCTRRIYSEFDNVKILKKRFSKFKNKSLSKRKRIKNYLSSSAAEACNSVYTSMDDRAICLRSAMGGYSTARLLASISKKDLPEFETPSKKKVDATVATHPEPQCRLDTYLRGALCDLSMDDVVSQSNPNKNLCNRFKTNNGSQAGVRSRCWYKPSESIQKISNVSEEVLFQKAQGRERVVH